jgi:hypothetical protein
VSAKKIGGSTGRKRARAPRSPNLKIPLPFESALEGLLAVKPKKKKKSGGE